MSRLHNTAKHVIMHPPTFVLAMGVAFIVAIIMTSISVGLYIQSGVANIDLSRPGYANIRKDIVPVDNNQGFSSNGPINPKTIDDFNALYKTQSTALHSYDSFSGSSLSNDNLGIPLGQ